jgi:hypothetical protein
MDMSGMLFWNVLLTLVIGPAFWTFRNLVQEVKRLDILLNKTREELAKDYVTKTEVHNDMNRVMDRLDALDAKIDRLIESRTP